LKSEMSWTGDTFGTICSCYEKKGGRIATRGNVNGGGGAPERVYLGWKIVPSFVLACSVPTKETDEARGGRKKERED